jgi:hypothetical protein
MKFPGLLLAWFQTFLSKSASLAGSDAKPDMQMGALAAPIRLPLRFHSCRPANRLAG